MVTSILEKAASAASTRKAKKRAKAAAAAKRFKNVGDVSIADLAVPTDPGYRVAYIKALAFTSEKYGIKEHKAHTLSWLRNQGKDVSLYEAAEEWRFLGVGPACWLADNGAVLSEATTSWLAAKLEAIEEAGLSITCAKEAASTTPSARKRTPLEVMREQTSDAIAQVDEWIDTGDYSKSLADVITKGCLIKTVHDYFAPVLAEVRAALEGKQPDLKEAYRRYQKPDLRALMLFLERIVGEAVETKEAKKAARKPRVTKVKSPDYAVKRLNYLKRCENLKLDSVAPTKIIGAEQLWVYNVKTRYLGVYRAETGKTLAIKGTSVLNYDTSSSVQKRIRKPEQVVPGVVKMGKVELRRALDNIKAKPHALRSRVSADVLLLRVA